MTNFFKFQYGSQEDTVAKCRTAVWSRIACKPQATLDITLEIIAFLAMSQFFFFCFFFDARQKCTSLCATSVHDDTSVAPLPLSTGRKQAHNGNCQFTWRHSAFRIGQYNSQGFIQPREEYWII